MSEEACDAVAALPEAEESPEGGAVKSRGKRSIIVAPERQEMVKDGVRYCRDANGRWRRVFTF